MKYYEVTFCVSPYNEDACDILSASLADSGFETFVPTEQGITAYVQQALFDESALNDAIEQYPLPDYTIQYEVNEAPKSGSFGSIRDA